MKKLLFYPLTLYSFSSFCQENAIYDFENLIIGDVINQDGWLFSTSLSTSNNAYNCPVIGSPIIPKYKQQSMMEITLLAKLFILEMVGEINT